MKVHGLALTHRTFVGFLALSTFLMEGFFFNVCFFGPIPHRSGSSPMDRAKLTPLHKYDMCIGYDTYLIR